MSTATETLEQEYDRLLGERGELGARLRKSEGGPTEDREQLRRVARRIREIVAIPPAGYELPKLAVDLVAHAEAHGWLSLVEWTPPDYEGEPYVSVQVGRQLAEGELPDEPGRKWIYQLTWHSRDCAPGKVRRFRAGLARTPDRPMPHDGPSVKAIRAVIEQHPKPGAAS